MKTHRTWILAGLVSVALFSVTTGAARGSDGFPYERDSGTDAATFGTGALLFGLGYLADRNFSPLTPEEIAALDPESINGFDKGAVHRWSPGADKASDYLATFNLIAPLSLMATTRGSKQAGTIGLMYAETLVLNGGAIYLLKNLFERTRPFVYNDDPDIPLELKMSRTARRSFPSGHTANAFAAMVFLASVYERLYPDSSSTAWVWGGCMASATVTGYLRYAAGRHYPTDILVGGAIGAVTGFIVPKIHETDPITTDGGASKGFTGAAMGLSFGF